jgi:hypothetical protein
LRADLAGVPDDVGLEQPHAVDLTDDGGVELGAAEGVAHQVATWDLAQEVLRAVRRFETGRDAEAAAALRQAHTRSGSIRHRRR